MTLIRTPPPDPAPGVAVKVYWLTTPRARAFPHKWPENDRIQFERPADYTYPANSEFWPCTVDGLRLYGLFLDYGCTALCVPLQP